MRRVSGVVGALVALLMAGGPALAHTLNVFAYVDADTVVVEVKFSNGRMAIAGAVKVYDGNDALIYETTVGPDGTARVPLANYETGLKIDVDAGEGHTNYWILTPQDIAAQMLTPVVGRAP